MVCPAFVLDAVAPRRGGEPEHHRARRRVDRIAHLLDSRFRLPVLGYRFGFDSILGLVPIAGDAVSAGFSGYLIYEAARAGAGPMLVARMIYNVAVDTLLGSVPVLGDLFDFAFKANLRNADLLRRHYDDLDSRPGGRHGRA